MNTRSFVIVIITVILILVGGIFYLCGGSSCVSQKEKIETPPVVVGTDMIHVVSPVPDGEVASPLTVRGEARGTWYFEASFPIHVQDANGNTIASVPAQAKSDWMTTEFVPFEATIEFDTPDTSTGFLVFQKDNPSGLPENDASFRMPIRFSQDTSGEKKSDFSKQGTIVRNNPGMKADMWYLIYEVPGAPALSSELLFNDKSECLLGGVAEMLCPSATFKNGDRVSVEGFENDTAVTIKKLEREGPTKAVQLYYYNAEKDKDPSGNVQCSDAGIVPVERLVPVTQTPIQDTLSLLIAGELTSAEKSGGISTEYPLSGLVLEAASLKDGTLKLTFSDPQNLTGGGSCRVGILWKQIERTAKQFPGVERVTFSPEELFQP